VFGYLQDVGMIDWEKIFNFFDLFHFKRIVKFLNQYHIEAVVDVGAHKGEFSHAVLRLNGLRQLYAFEPQKAIFPILKERFKSHGIVDCYNNALDNVVAEKKMNISKLSSTSTLSDFNKKSFYMKVKRKLIGAGENAVDSCPVNSVTMDHFFKDIHLNNALLKIDVEGYEYEVLQGAVKKLKEVKLILIENQFLSAYTNQPFSVCDRLLRQHQFVCVKRFVYPLLHFEDRLYIKVE
jgi:FkbM family methyltransferase